MSCQCTPMTSGTGNNVQPGVEYTPAGRLRDSIGQAMDGEDLPPKICPLCHRLQGLAQMMFCLLTLTSFGRGASFLCLALAEKEYVMVLFLSSNVESKFFNGECRCGPGCCLRFHRGGDEP